MGGAVREVQGSRRAAPLNEGVRDSRSNAPTAGPRRTWWVVASVASIVAIDQLTKAWAVSNLADGPKHVIGDTVELSLTRNGGSAFSRFQGMTPILAVGAVIVTIVLVRVLQGVTDRVLVVGLSLVLGGALGNLSDRFLRAPGFLRGHVVDFVAVGWWPVFNVADSCVTIGAILLILRSLRTPPERPASG
jgi:signal peptidase II